MNDKRYFPLSVFVLGLAAFMVTASACSPEGGQKGPSLAGDSTEKVTEGGGSQGGGAPAEGKLGGRTLALISEKVISARGGTTPAQTLRVNNVFKIEFSPDGQGVAYILETSEGLQAALMERIGKTYSAIGEMAISPGGKHIAYSAFDGKKWCIVRDTEEEPFSGGLGEPVFSPDSRHLAYDVETDGTSFLVVDGKRSEQQPPGYAFHDKFFSRDSQRVIAVLSPDEMGGLLRVVVSDLSFESPKAKELPSFDYVLNQDRTRIAVVSGIEGKKQIVSFAIDPLDPACDEGPLYDNITQLSFAPDGVTVAYLAEKNGTSYIVLGDRNEEIPTKETEWTLVVRPDKRAVGIILEGPEGSFLHEVFDSEAGSHTKYLDAGELVYSPDSTRHAYAATWGQGVFMVVNGKEGPIYDMLVSPMYSPDGRFLVWRARRDNKRFVVVADPDGKVLREGAGHEMVFPVSFSENGESIAYGVKDGPELKWVVEKL